MSEFWLISAPGDKTCQETFDKLNRATAVGDNSLSANHKFNIPDLKVRFILYFCEVVFHSMVRFMCLGRDS